MNDIEIAKKIKLEKIEKITEKLGIDNDYIEPYGNYKAKVNLNLYNKIKNKKDGKLVLVTSINPTPLGEGKTTVSIGLADGLSKIGEMAILALREPSLGPVFGIKGGATGGGYSQVAPMEDINLHFTGDLHAITTANNLLAAMIDNHIFHGNELGFKTVTWKRCVDLNDRQLRKVETGLSGEKKMVSRYDGFDISVASEIMAVFCLSTDLMDLKRRLGNIIVGYNKESKPITARDLKAEGSLAVLLKDALNPNIVQTLEQTPALIHGGPFANIAHGCNSIIATKMALKLADYTITEAGFGADLGAEKFLNIKCRKANIKPDVVVCVATLKALKYHGGAEKEDVQKENISLLEKGLANLLKHVDNLKNKFGLNVIVAINKFSTDTEDEIEFLKKKMKELNIEVCLVESWEKGGKGAEELARSVVRLSKKENNFKFIYDGNETIKEKIKKVSKQIYGAEDVLYSELADESIKKIECLNYGKLPICIAKTQYSFSDDEKKLVGDEKFSIHVEDVILRAGAEFIVIITGKIMTMPGLPKVPAAETIGLDNNQDIVGIF
ncbi:MAG: formate--tetrahydrofolate ligase [Clostridia bacterium]|nr:formate--tetrahydrofolate ligase [Clostridia bacterium]